MPRYNVFIRKTDAHTWERIVNRPEWLHYCLEDYKKQHPEIGLTEVKPEKSPSAEKGKKPPLLISGIDESE
jgi:hypothetical protein